MFLITEIIALLSVSLYLFVPLHYTLAFQRCNVRNKEKLLCWTK